MEANGIWMGWGPLSPWPAKQDFCCRVPCLQGSGDTLESSKLAKPQLQLQRQFVLPGEHVQPVSIGSTIRYRLLAVGRTYGNLESASIAAINGGPHVSIPP